MSTDINDLQYHVKQEMSPSSVALEEGVGLNDDFDVIDQNEERVAIVSDLYYCMILIAAYSLPTNQEKVDCLLFGKSLVWGCCRILVIRV